MSEKIKNHRRRIFLLCIFLLIGAACQDPLPTKVIPAKLSNIDGNPPQQSIEERRILLVHSYHSGYAWTDAITHGVHSVLKGNHVDFEIFYMDTKRKTQKQWKVRAGELAMVKVKEFRPDVVITADDNAQQYFGMKFVENGQPIVFCGVNADPSKYGYPSSNVTGIIERPHFKATLALLNSLHPVRNVAIISSEDPTSIGALNFMKQDYVTTEVVEWKLIHDFEQWKKKVMHCNKSVDALGIYMYHTIRDSDSEESIEPEKVLEWTVSNAAIPTFGFFAFAIEDGLMVGVAESGFEHGERAAKYALDILNGTPVSSLPVIKAHVGNSMVNVKTAKQIGISIDGALEGTVNIVGRDR